MASIQHFTGSTITDCEALVDAAFRILTIPVEWNGFCSYCQDDRLFIARYESAEGLVATCSHCGREHHQPFTRATTEVV